MTLHVGVSLWIIYQSTIHNARFEIFATVLIKISVS